MRSAPPKFAVDDRIRLKPGVSAGDLQLGGWTGVVVGVIEMDTWRYDVFLDPFTGDDAAIPARCREDQLELAP